MPSNDTSSSGERIVQTTDIRLVRRLRWIAVLLIAANAAVTLAAQPRAFWRVPGEAIRFDGLPVHSATNPMFDFFLGFGWPAYIAAVALFAGLVWLTLPALPKRLALTAAFTVILGLCFSGGNWLAVRWHLGTEGVILYVAPVAIILANAVAPLADEGNGRALRYLCGLASLTTIIDGVVTLIGQPAGYWHNTMIIHEANPASAFFLETGPWAYAGYIAAQAAVAWIVAMKAPGITGWAIAFGIAIGGFFGASNWSFYEWYMGVQTPLLYALLLSAVMAWTFLPRRRRANDEAPGDMPRKSALGCC